MFERGHATTPPHFYFPPPPDSVPCKFRVGSGECDNARKAMKEHPLSPYVADRHPQLDSSLIEIYCKACPVAAQATVAVWAGLTRSKVAA